jgi:signal transduction histidine kinase
MLTTGETVIVPDTRTDPLWVPTPGTTWLCSYAAAPIRVQDKTLGFLNVDSATPGFYGAHHAERLKMFADQAAIALTNAQLYQAAQETALRLQTTSNRLLKAQETERRSIARELHDEIGQTLTAVKINLQAVQRASDLSAQASILDESITVIERALQQVRNLSLDLHPSLLDDLGLVPALRWYMHRQAERAGFAVTVVADSLEAHLPPDLEIVCFRVVQEALTNVARHARAQHVLVELRQSDTQLELVIRDDGVGFDVPSALERAARGASLGLRGMEERVTLVGGQMEIESVLTHGTEIRARFPLVAP